MRMITKYFYWSGIDEKGQYHQDGQFAKNKTTLIKQLRQNNITLLQTKTQTLINFKKRIHKKYAIEFIKQLSILLSANINLIDAIKILKNEQHHPKLRSILKGIQQKIEAGHSLSQAMQVFPHFCDNHIHSTIRAAERTGKLPTLLKQLSKQLQQQYQIKKKLIAALYYPITLLTVAILISIGLLVFAIPQFKNIYASFGAPLPTFTRVVIQFAHYARVYSIHSALIALTVSCIIIFLYKKSKWLKLSIHKCLLKIPIIKALSLDHNLGQWSHILSHSYAAGLPLIEAITLANETLNNQQLQQAFNPIASQLEAGASFSHIIKQQPLFNCRQQHLLTLGDQAGELQQVLLQMSQQCFDRLQNTLANLSKLLEPVIIVGIALICGSCIIAMYLPIFNIGAIV